MCLGVPSKVIALGNGVATVESFNTQREVSLLMLEESVAIGDYLLIQIGGFAAEKISADDAKLALETIESLSSYEHWGEKW